MHSFFNGRGETNYLFNERVMMDNDNTHEVEIRVL
jgi:hypothetical protein